MFYFILIKTKVCIFKERLKAKVKTSLTIENSKNKITNIMDKADILYHIQKKLIEDLGFIVSDLEVEYKNSLNNSWVFNLLYDLIKKLRPARVDKVDYTRNQMETDLRNTIDKHYKVIQGHIPEIEVEDIHSLISVLGDLYELIYSRAEAELSTLGSNTSKYESPEQLVMAEFENSKAFETKEEHQEWLSDVLGKLGSILNYFDNLGQTLASKTGLMWKIKVKFAKHYLKWKLGIQLDIPKLSGDISVAKKAVINSYRKFENRLIECRYC